MADDLIEIAALWENASKKSGRLYLRGRFADCVAPKIVAFRDENKASDRAPDWRLYISREEATIAAESDDEVTILLPKVRTKKYRRNSDDTRSMRTPSEDRRQSEQDDDDIPF